jgi:hypothetical protein
MNARNKGTLGNYSERHMPGFAEVRKSTENLGLSAASLGQMKPQRCPQPENGDQPSDHAPRLGPPLTIGEVAQLLGCSEWTVRQRYLRLGLPCLRTSATGKLVFFREQVIDWIFERQQRQRGGIR